MTTNHIGRQIDSGNMIGDPTGYYLELAPHRYAQSDAVVRERGPMRVDTIAVAILLTGAVAWSVTRSRVLMGLDGKALVIMGALMSGPLPCPWPLGQWSSMTTLSEADEERIQAIIHEIRLAADDPSIKEMVRELERTVDTAGISPRTGSSPLRPQRTTGS